MHLSIQPRLSSTCSLRGDQTLVVVSNVGYVLVGQPILKIKNYGSYSGHNKRLAGNVGPIRSLSVASKGAAGKTSTKSKKTRKNRMSRPEMESLEMIEWKDVCKQVASFAETPRGAQLAYGGNLYIGKTVEESIELLQQTKEAMDVNISFDGIYDLRKATEVAMGGQNLHPLVLGAFATTLESIDHLKSDLEKHGPNAASLQALCKPLNDFEYSMIASEIRKRVNIQDGRIHDDATEELKRIRLERKENLSNLFNASDAWARQLFSSGASERPQVVIRRDRRCVPVKAGRNGELPKGSVTLAMSGSGNTMYIEPEPLIPLNNKEIELSSAETEEEEKILEEATKLIVQHAAMLRKVFAIVTRIDLAIARARHAKWIRGVQPQLAVGNRGISCTETFHPLLIQSELSELPPPKLPQAVMPTAYDSMNSPLAGMNLVPELWSRESKAESRERLQEKQKVGVEDSIAIDSEVIPIDISIPAGKSVVVMSGPNTGGKTASLKTLGLISLMAKAGLFIPVKDSNISPNLQWFDKILVDVGDGQSLQQSLSTFSGHVRRLRGVLEESTSQSLVLLDEIGSGTDPTEGAALASAILKKLASGKAALTFATTHHAELKELAAQDSSFVDASVEFNVKTLLPTYKILWGASGKSHALSVADGLGFDRRILSRAEVVATKLVENSKSQFLRMESLKESLPDQLSKAQRDADQARNKFKLSEKSLSQAETDIKYIQEEYANLGKSSSRDSQSPNVQKIQQDIKKTLKKLKNGELSPIDADKYLRNISSTAQQQASKAIEAMIEEDAPRSDSWIPKRGETVRIVNMGGALATVESVNSNKQKVSVLLGMMKMDINIADISPTRGQKAPKKDKLSLESAQSKDTIEQSEYSYGMPAIQTSQNTVDLRGETADDAISSLQQAIGTARPASILFVVHGVGSGRVRAAVLGYLRNNSNGIRKIEQDPGSNGGCTIVYLQ